jgi:GntR family transcriptional regulator, transcriptional repressor for pyruvate dehydrogenase complex
LQVHERVQHREEAHAPEEAFNELDTEFHVAIAEASGNHLVADMTTAIRGAVRPQIMDAIGRIEDWPAVAADLRAQHRSVLDAIAKGDVEAASDAVEAHIRGFFAGLR